TLCEGCHHSCRFQLRHTERPGSTYGNFLVRVLETLNQRGHRRTESRLCPIESRDALQSNLRVAIRHQRHVRSEKLRKAQQSNLSSLRCVWSFPITHHLGKGRNHSLGA